MKKLIALLLCLVMALSLVACGSKQDDTQAPADDQQGAEETSLVDAAKAEGKLVVYGSCEEEYLAAACENFEKMYGIEVEYQRLSTRRMAMMLMHCLDAGLILMNSPPTFLQARKNSCPFKGAIMNT